MPVDISKVPPKFKQWIDNSTYEEMLARFRFSPMGDPIMMGESGNYFTLVFMRKHNELTEDERVQISHRVGWDSKDYYKKKRSKV
jgi:hypothetical protein